MQVTLLTVGKPSANWAIEAVEHYTKFLSKYARVDLQFVRAASGRGGSPEVEKRAEAESLLKSASTFSGFKIACDATGRSFSSERFALLIRMELDQHSGRALVIVGGPHGLDQTILDWADLIWSLGPMTLPHEMALVVAMEQLARACSINRGESYHK
ncbi:MAG: 23S rRNA (pseudouridine(1915)-N(3))-methyltransferase RlmH [candidate division Zixibacteria bacterium]|nr:23S rRNA (pseudouridine(1915)-N(3))-methyltransferase RlmH [candidate division Zixibacteria bacterium]